MQQFPKYGTPALFDVSRRVNESYHGFHLIFTNMGDLTHEHHICFSYVGRTNSEGDGKGQVVNLGSEECLNIGKILHETLHALGEKLWENTNGRINLFRGWVGVWVGGAKVVKASLALGF